MRVLDRYILRTLTMNYAIALFVMVSLCLALDLILNIDEFTERGLSPATVLQNIASYYGAVAFLYFSQISGIITLFACTVTLARLRRLNELTAMAASGISLHRVSVLVFGFGLAATGLWVLNNEFVIPSLAAQLARRRDDSGGSRSHGVWFQRDRDGGLLSAQQFHPQTATMKHLLVMHRDPAGAFDEFVEAEQARWEPRSGHPRGGVWKLERGLKRTFAARESSFGPSVGDPPWRNEIRSQLLDVYESDLDPAAIRARQSAQWLKYLSSAQLSALAVGSPADAPEIQQIQQSRFVTPIFSMVLLLLGVPFFLNRSPGSLLADGARCLAVCGLCYVVGFGCQFLAQSGSDGASLWAWLPALFAIPAVIRLDRVRT